MTKAKVQMGTASNDKLIGTNNVDFLYGLAGNDYLSGGNSADIIKGGDGDDTLEGGKGIDQLTGGAGNDTFVYKILADITPSTSYYNYQGVTVAQYHFEEITDFNLGDSIDFSAIPAESRQFIGENEFSGVAGEVRYSYNMMGADKLEFDQDGDSNPDAVIEFYDMMNSGFSHYNPITGKTVYEMIVETETNSGVFVLVEDTSDVVLTGDSDTNTLMGGEGDDKLSGSEGDDYLDGKTGSDQLDGGAGNDTLVSGLGSDYLVGGDGADTFIFNEPDEFSDYGYMGMGIQPFSSSISDFSKDDQIVIDMPFALTFVDSAEFSGLAGEYRFKDDSFSFDFDGDKSVDASIYLSKSNSTPIILLKEISKNHFAFDKSVQFGSSENDTLMGTNADDKIFGNSGNDSLVGSAGNDALNGDYGNDTLIGGLGKDTLTGGGDKDTFVFAAVEKNIDTITDFQIGYSSYYSGYESNDKIDLSAIDANSKTKADQAFNFVGSANFTKLAGELHFVNGILEGDTNGDAKADFSIQLNGVSSLTAVDFLL